MTSNELQSVQEQTKKYLEFLINETMIDFKLIKKTLAVLEQVDTTRREKWNDEHFGAYNEMVEEHLKFDIESINEAGERVPSFDISKQDVDFNSDDIPF